MTRNQIVDTHPPQGATHDAAVSPVVFGWDWSATTHEAAGPKRVRELVDALGPAVVMPGRGLHGWAHGVEAYDADGYRVGSVYYGGREDLYVVSTSGIADTTREAVTGLHGARTARVDTRVDTLLSFDALEDVLRAVGDPRSNLTKYERTTVAGDAKGRTIYLGSPKSAIYIRVYEKWLESPGEYLEGTNRVEVQLRPASRAKVDVSGWSREETFCASRTTQALADELGADLIPTPTLHVGRSTPDLERTLAAMGKQYRRAVDLWLQLSGGDLGTVIDHLCGVDMGGQGTYDGVREDGEELARAVSVALGVLG